MGRELVEAGMQTMANSASTTVLPTLKSGREVRGLLTLVIYLVVEKYGSWGRGILSPQDAR